MKEETTPEEIFNSMSDCANACAALTLTTEASQERRAALFDRVSWFVDSAPLIEGPDVRGAESTKNIVRNAATVAVRLKLAVVAWDGTTEPPPSLVDLAREFLAAIGMPDLGNVPT
jgi:hypothetical protein